MMFEAMLQRFTKKSPVTVMARVAIERALGAEHLDGLFKKKAVSQYEKQIMFSALVDLMSLVVCKVYSHVSAAYRAVSDTLPASLQAVYDKLKGVEKPVLVGLVHHTYDQLAPVITAMKARTKSWLPGYHVRILDGNHLPATERRLKALRGSVAGPLPGHSLVIVDPQLGLVSDVIPCEDAHAQERSLLGEVLDLVRKLDVWLGDRNFCTLGFLFGIAKRDAYFVIRQHANLPIESAGTVHDKGRCSTGRVTEQKVTIKLASEVKGEPDQSLELRRITLHLDEPTRDGDIEMSVLTNVPAKDLPAIAGVELYRKRWTIETMFQKVEQVLNSELSTLGYPKAALFGFAVALCAFNVYSVVQAALEVRFGEDVVREEVSGYSIADEIRVVQGGMDVALDDEIWDRYRIMSASELARELIAMSEHVNLARYKKTKRGPKKPVPKRTKYVNDSHVSTARLLTRAGAEDPTSS